MTNPNNPTTPLVPEPFQNSPKEVRETITLITRLLSSSPSSLKLAEASRLDKSILHLSALADKHALPQLKAYAAQLALQRVEGGDKRTAKGVEKLAEVAREAAEEERRKEEEAVMEERVGRLREAMEGVVEMPGGARAVWGVVGEVLFGA